MSEATTTPAGITTLRRFTLDQPIVIAGAVVVEAGTEIVMRKPGGGELRGLAIAALLQMDYNQLEALAPRITTPVLHKHMFAAMDPGDITQFGSEVADFLLPTGVKASSQPA